MMNSCFPGAQVRLCAALLCAVAMPPVHAAAATQAAWVDPAVPEAAAALRVKRAGKQLSYQDARGLLPCDQVELIDRNAIVRLVLADGGRVLLNAAQPAATVPCAAPSVGQTLGKLLLALRTQADARQLSVATLSRDVGGAAVMPSDSTPALSVPVLFAPRAVIGVPGTGDAIHLAWRGGRGPYRMVLGRALAGPLVERAGIAAHQGALDGGELAPGLYTLTVQDAAGGALGEENLELVAPHQIPPMPSALRTAPLSASARTLFYADYLVAYEDGRYALAAMQLVARLHPQSAASRAWLQAWGQGD